MPDMRDELVGNAGDLLDVPAPYSTARKVIDSIPPGSFKLDEKTWVRLEGVTAIGRTVFGLTLVCADGTQRRYADSRLYTEVDHAE